jgi:hypothetical protein
MGLKRTGFIFKDNSTFLWKTEFKGGEKEAENAGQ